MPTESPLPQGHVAEHQHGVERMVEQAEAGRLVGHHAAAIDQEDDPLALVGLEVLDGELVPPGGAAPVDVLVVVVERVVAEPLELVVLADSPRAAHAQQAEPVGAGQQGVFGQLLHVGIDVDVGYDGIFDESAATGRTGCGRADRPLQRRMHRGAMRGNRSAARRGCGPSRRHWKLGRRA